MSTTSNHAARCFLAISSSLLASSGCASDGDARGSGVGINETTQALSAGDLLFANGTYGGSCRNRSGAWSVDIAGGSTLDHPPLSVILNNTSCVLTLTGLHMAVGPLDAVPELELTASFQSPSAFGDPVQFYANARLDSVSFADDFVLSILYSDDPALANGNNTANLDVVGSSATASSVPAPNYSINCTGITIQTDANDVVQSTSGNASLTADTVTGQLYVVVEAGSLATYAQLDAAFLAGSQVAVASTIPASSFTLEDTDLTDNQVRTVIIANTSNGVRSYQAFQITFHPAI